MDRNRNFLLKKQSVCNYLLQSYGECSGFDKFSADSAPTSFSGDVSSGSAGLEGFREFISLGEKFSGLNARLAEVYFEHLPGMLDLLSHEGLRLFYSITDSLLKFRWEIAADIFDEAKDVFSAIPPPRQKELLTALNKFAGCMETFPSCSDRAAAAPALFKNAPAAMANLDSRGFEAWVSIAEEITDISSDAAVTFLNRSPGALRYLKINELRQWAEKGITLLSLKTGFESFMKAALKGWKNTFNLLILRKGIFYLISEPKSRL